MYLTLGFGPRNALGFSCSRTLWYAYRSDLRYCLLTSFPSLCGDHLMKAGRIQHFCPYSLVKVMLGLWRGGAAGWLCLKMFNWWLPPLKPHKHYHVKTLSSDYLHTCTVIIRAVLVLTNYKCYLYQRRKSGAPFVKNYV